MVLMGGGCLLRRRPHSSSVFHRRRTPGERAGPAARLLQDRNISAASAGVVPQRAAPARHRVVHTPPGTSRAGAIYQRLEQHTRRIPPADDSRQLPGRDASDQSELQEPHGVGLAIANLRCLPPDVLHGLHGTIQIAESVAVMGLGDRDDILAIFLAIQNSAPRSQIGIASSMSQFMGNLGGTIGLAILGTIQVNTFASKIPGVLAGVSHRRIKRRPFNIWGTRTWSARFCPRLRCWPSAIWRGTLRSRPCPSSGTRSCSRSAPLSRSAWYSRSLLVAGLLLTGSMKQQMAARRQAMAEAKGKEGGYPDHTRRLSCASR